MRKTHTLVQVAAALAAAPDEKHWGYQLSKQSGVRPGAMYPVLDRLLGAGWLSDGWEQVADGKRQRPARRYYQVTESGRDGLRGLLDDARSDSRFASLLAAATVGQPGADLGQTANIRHDEPARSVAAGTGTDQREQHIATRSKTN